MSGSGTSAFGNLQIVDSFLLSDDFDRVDSISQVRSDTEGSGFGNNQVYVGVNQQSAQDIFTGVHAGALNSYIVVFNGNEQCAQLLVDHDWSDVQGRTIVATLVGMRAEDVFGLTLNSFYVWRA